MKVLSRMILSLLPAGYILVSPAQADLPEQFFDPVDGRFDASTYLSENAFGFLPVPVIITEPAVEGGLGMTGLFSHESDEDAAVRKEAMLSSGNAAAHLLPPSASAIFGAYTGNESWLLGAGHMGFFKEGKIRYKGGGGYGDVNLDYYSIGDIELSRPLSLSTKFAAIFQTLKFQVGDSPVFIGATQRYVDAELSLNNSNSDAGGDLGDLLATDVTTSGLGLVAEFDSRDNLFTPKAGFYYDFSYLAYRDSIGSDIDYDLYSLGGLNYFRISKSLRGGLRLNAEVADSDEALPPFAQPSMSLRGLPAARYQGIDVARGPEDTVLYIQAGSAW